MSGKVSRRLVVGVIGTGAVAVPLAAAGAMSVVGPNPPAATSGGAPADADGASVDASALIAPLVAGSRLARWSIAEVRPLERGALTVVMADADGQRFSVEILARDGSPLGVRPVAETASFAVYMRNGGDGDHPTLEDHGIAAMTLAQVVSRNEASVDRAPFLTHAERYARHPGLRQQVTENEARS